MQIKYNLSCGNLFTLFSLKLIVGNCSHLGLILVSDTRFGFQGLVVSGWYDFG